MDENPEVILCGKRGETKDREPWIKAWVRYERSYKPDMTDTEMHQITLRNLGPKPISKDIPF